uniref:uncharacterized protein LOC128928308 n=1 Tax=Callithrix jacchus TaxID=9483 RepID=UPI0004F08CF1|nr:uncharacterized protein LOC128928308 [Callithrix jacchus]
MEGSYPTPPLPDVGPLAGSAEASAPGRERLGAEALGLALPARSSHLCLGRADPGLRLLPQHHEVIRWLPQGTPCPCPELPGVLPGLLPPVSSGSPSVPRNMAPESPSQPPVMPPKVQGGDSPCREVGSPCWLCAGVGRSGLLWVPVLTRSWAWSPGPRRPQWDQNLKAPLGGDFLKCCHLSLPGPKSVGEPGPAGASAQPINQMVLQRGHLWPELGEEVTSWDPPQEHPQPVTG